MRPRFEPEEEPAPSLNDPVSYDASEERFAASLERQSPLVSDQLSDEAEYGPVSDSQSAVETRLETQVRENLPAALAGKEESLECNPAAHASWRDEVAARVSHYRSRKRPRAPRYPSLQLKFESSQAAWSSRPAPVDIVAPASRESVAFVHAEPEATARYATSELEISPLPQAAPEPANNLIPFPRSSSVVPPAHMDELAGPVPDRLRIIEAPEVTPLPPALGGILIEPAEEAAQEKRPGFEMPLQSSSISRRLAAAVGDGLLIMAAFTLFAYVVFRIAHPALLWRPLVGLAVALTGIFWAVYQYIFLVFTGSTPGLRCARLYPARFDGTYAPRRLRRWRSLAAVLSGVSLGLGYLWCFLDEDGLSWHDRITRTHLAPRK
jgi:uncharacterized RDD family membrane protein YckC